MVVVSRVPGWSRAAIGQWALAPPRQVWPFRPLHFPIRRDLFNGVVHTAAQRLPVSPPIQNVVDDNIDGKDNQKAQKGQRHDRKDPFNPVHFAPAFPAHRFASRPSSDTDTTHAAGTKSCTKTPAAQGIILKRAVGTLAMGRSACTSACKSANRAGFMTVSCRTRTRTRTRNRERPCLCGRNHRREARLGAISERAAFGRRRRPPRQG